MGCFREDPKAPGDDTDDQFHAGQKDRSAYRTHRNETFFMICPQAQVLVI
jgi:hypothetical protein